jgi:hypothetical protein
LKRDYTGTNNDGDNQGLGFTGIALKGVEGARLWSKAGWTSTTRHDVAYIELPDGRKFVLAVFTSDHANEREIIPTVAREVMEGLKGSAQGVERRARSRPLPTRQRPVTR